MQCVTLAAQYRLYHREGQCNRYKKHGNYAPLAVKATVTWLPGHQPGLQQTRCSAPNCNKQLQHMNERRLGVA